MEVGILLDSVILIDHLNGVSAATEYLRTVEGANVSVITRAEVLTGIDARDRDAVIRLLNRYATLSIDRKTADLAANLRRKYRWRLPDAFQTALAELNHLKLATRNTRDFPPQKYAFVVVPYAVK